jgi:P-type Cu2+ transporter
VYLGGPGHWLARFDFCDPLRAEAQEVVAYFQAQGKQVILLSGDSQAIASQVAARLGIEEAHGDHLPEQKLAFVQALQSTGAVVTMVGDGLNDTAVLAAADVSFAMGSGAALAQTHADAVLLSGRLWSLVESAEVAGKTMRIIRQNLAWATVYNLVAIPAAAFGLLGPLASGVGMTASSVLVVLNALRLHWRIRQQNRGAASTAAAMPAGSRLTQQKI